MVERPGGWSENTWSRLQESCGPASLASALGITREEAAGKVVGARPEGSRMRNYVCPDVLAKAAGGRYYTNVRRRTLRAFLRDQHPDSECIVLASRHFVHIRGCEIVEDNGRTPMRGIVKGVIRW